MTGYLPTSETFREKFPSFDEEPSRLKPRPRQGEKSTLIYVVACEEFVKIGRAADMRLRLSSMQGGNPFEVRLIRTFDVEPARADEIEKWAQACISGERVRGEWFRATPEAAILAVETAFARPARRSARL